MMMVVSQAHRQGEFDVTGLVPAVRDRRSPMVIAESGASWGRLRQEN